ncbi:DinB/UmuC family translesion DNA polymerase [Citrobacter sp.]|uniref:DinB/UmuC family translesion DNA polymerase n=1 Tax=Citrobacter sp. TaxID=1896336 RepID=UPI002FC905D1
MCSFASRAAERLRGEHQYCRFISAFVKTSPFALNEPCYGSNVSVKLLTPTRTVGISSVPLSVVWMPYGRTGIGIRKPGTMLGDFYSQGVAQLNLFDDNAPRKNSARLIEVLD